LFGRRLVALAIEDTAAALGSLAASYQGLVALWPGPAALLDRSGRLLAVNPAGRKLLAEHGPACEILGRNALTAAASTATGIAGGQLDLMAVPVDGAVLLLGRDMTLASNLQAALAESRARYKDLVEISSDFAWETDASGVFTFVSPRGALGYGADELVGRHGDSLLLEPVDGEATPFAPRQPVESAELWLRRADGTPACVVVSARPMAGGTRGVCRDVSEERARDQALADARHRERLMAYVVRAIRDQVEPAKTLEAAVNACARALDADAAALWRVSADNVARAATRGEAAGLDDDIARQAIAAAGALDLDVGGQRVLIEATRFAGRVNGALGVVRGAGRAAWTEAEHTFLGDLAAQLGIAFAQIEAQENLGRLADTDTLTGLMNRRAFARAVERRLHLATRNAQRGALIYIDLDNFKPINDRLGHQAGDVALQEVARLLGQLGRTSDLVARLGGDEFAMWLDSTDREGARTPVSRVLDLKGNLIGVSAEPKKPLTLSVGVAIYDPWRPETVDALMARADTAMYAAKRAGKGTYRFAALPKAKKKGRA
jgi:diguanylate cyclase (GGDEF)-like protein/PAS domain S-box-containing protein